MKLAINQRLFEYFENQGISNVSFQKAIGLKNAQQISNWKKLNEPIPQDHLFSAISLFGNLNGHWLLTGNGKMLIETESPKQFCADVARAVKMDEVDVGYNCKLCAEKERLIEMQNRHIAFLEFSLGKNLKTGSE